ncbi:MAG TPA: hypothetical protein VGM19_02185 [Armatimonadota bacterium]|jgi:hypothetical protein
MKRLAACLVLFTALSWAWGQTPEPITESLTGWGMQNHQDAALPPHADKLRLDPVTKRFGANSIAFDIVRGDVDAYTDVRYTPAQPMDLRAFDVVHFSYFVPAGMNLVSLEAMFNSVDWKSSARLKEPLKGVTGSWQDVAIPLTSLLASDENWDWGKAGTLMFNFYWWGGAKQTGTVHLDGVWFERTGTGIGNRQAPPALLFLTAYEPDKDIEPVHRKQLEGAGYTVVFDTIQHLTWDRLRQFNAVILGIIPEEDVNQPGEWLGLPGVRSLLERYVAAGGGLLVCNTPVSKLGETGIGLLLKPLGMTLINEQVTDPGGLTYTQEMYPMMSFAYADGVAPDPLSEGVPGLWYCTSLQFTGAGGGGFTDALDPGPDWRVLLRASATAATHKFSGSFGIEPGLGTVKSAPVLCAAREVGKGRVAVLPINPTHLWLSGYHDWWQGLAMTTGAKGKPSGGERLLTNLYTWLAAPSVASRAVGGYLGDKPAPIVGATYVSTGDAGGVMDWNKMTPPEASPNNLLGLVGAHTAFSDGTGTVAEWVAAAQAAKYDWIAFTEPLTAMTSEKWDQLKAQCKAASNDQFCAIPGLEIVDPAGNHSLVLAPIPWPDPKLVAERMDLPQALGYAYGAPVQVQFRMHEGLAPWYRSQFHYAGVFTYRDGKLVEDAEKDYWELQARTFKCYPLAVHEVFRPADVARERATGYQNYYTYGPLKKMYDDFCFGDYKFFFYHDLLYISSGPKIERYTVQNSGTSYFDIPPGWSDSWRETVGADRLRVVARASSPVGLARLRVLDAGQVLRNYACGGAQEFSQFVDGHHDRQYAFGVEVVDTAGGRALASSVGTTCGRHYLSNCSDNVNIMTGGTFGSTLQPPKGFECYFSRWGEWLPPDLYFQDRQPLNFPHDERLQFGSTDLLIVDHLFSLTHAPDVLQVGGGRMMRPLLPLKDFEARQREYAFTPNPNSPQYKLWELQVKFKRDVTVEAGPFPNLRLAFWLHGAPPTAGDFAYATLTTADGRTLVEKTPADKVWPAPVYTGTLPLGGYAGAFPNYTGAGAVFALDSDVQFAVEGNAQARRIQIGKQIAPGTVLKAGTVISARVLFMEGKWNQLAGNGELENTRKYFGLGGGAPGYTVTPTVGTVARTQYACTLQPAGGGFRAQFSAAPIETDLPIIMPGLQPRWDSGVWIVGSDRVRFFGRWDDTGYTTLRLDKPLEAFLGHPLVCDQPQVWLTLVEADSKHLLAVAHNPTDQPLTVHVRKATGFALGPALDTTVKIPAASSVTIKVPAG